MTNECELSVLHNSFSIFCVQEKLCIQLRNKAGNRPNLSSPFRMKISALTLRRHIQSPAKVTNQFVQNNRSLWTWKSRPTNYKLASGGSELISAPGRRFLLSLRENALLLRRHKYITNWEPRALAPRPLIAKCNKRVRSREQMRGDYLKLNRDPVSSRSAGAVKWKKQSDVYELLCARQRETSGSATDFFNGFACSWVEFTTGKLCPDALGAADLLQILSIFQSKLDMRRMHFSLLIKIRGW